MKYVRNSPTSMAAAASVVNPGTKRLAVLQFIGSRGPQGATDDEIQVGLGMSPSTERPRRIELFEMRQIARTTRTRSTRTGRQAAVYVTITTSKLGEELTLAPTEKPCCPSCGRPF